MRPAAQLAAFGAGLLVAFGAAFALGSAVGPDLPEPVHQAPATAPGQPGQQGQPHTDGH